MPTHWTEKLFIEESDLFRATIEARLQKTPEEIVGLIELFNLHGVPEDGLILDLGCGIGRVSVPLAKNGYNVVGVDISPPYVQRANEYAEGEGVSDRAQFIVGDIREISKALSGYSNGFDAVISMWTSMGYWYEETDVNILRQSLSLTKPSGFFIMQTASRDGLVKRFQARDFVEMKDGLVMLMERTLDLETSRMVDYWTYYQREGNDLRYLNRLEINHRVYALHELIEQFQGAGWSYVASYGGLDQRLFTMNTFSMVIVAQRP